MKNLAIYILIIATGSEAIKKLDRQSAVEKHQKFQGQINLALEEIKNAYEIARESVTASMQTTVLTVMLKQSRVKPSRAGSSQQQSPSNGKGHSRTAKDQRSRLESILMDTTASLGRLKDESERCLSSKPDTIIGNVGAIWCIQVVERKLPRLVDAARSQFSAIVEDVRNVEKTWIRLAAGHENANDREDREDPDDSSHMGLSFPMGRIDN